MNEEQARKFVESLEFPVPDIGFDEDCDGMKIWKPLDLSWNNGKPIPEYAEYRCYTAKAVKKAIVSALVKLGQQNVEVEFFVAGKYMAGAVVDGQTIFTTSMTPVKISAIKQG